MALRYCFARCAARCATWALRRVFHRPAGYFPGKTALTLDPLFLHHARAELRTGSIIITGTNGKTTVTNMVADVLSEEGFCVVCNRDGSNLAAGVACALAQFRPRKPADPAAPAPVWGVFEVDELWVAHVLPQLQSTYLAVLDLFPDQVDRMGSVEHLVEVLAGALKQSPATTLIYNGDDPNCRALAAAVSNKSIALCSTGKFADTAAQGAAPAQGDVQSAPLAQADVQSATRTDARAFAQPAPFAKQPHEACRACGAPLDYAFLQYGQLGDYRCTTCGFCRPSADCTITALSQTETALSFELAFSGTTPAESWVLEAPCAGTYMFYNLAFVGLLSRVLGASYEAACRQCAAFCPQNGRLERLCIGGHPVLINLAKNPVGFDQNIELLLRHPGRAVVAFFANNNWGDGLDYTWIDDVNFAALAPRAAAGELRVFAGGMCTEALLAALSRAGISARAAQTVDEVLAALRADEAKAGTEIATPEGCEGDVADAEHVSAERYFFIANYTALPAVKNAAERLAKA